MAARILMTGASGFVGPYLHGALIRRFPNATVIGLRSMRPAEAIPRDDLLQVDLTDYTAVNVAVASAQPDLVLHLAAQASVDRAQAGQDTTWLVNVAGTLNLALAVARHAPQASVLFASSSEVYGGHLQANPVNETVAPCPLNPYARSKLTAELVLASVLPLTARLVVARSFNHTGIGQRENFVLPSFARQIARIEAGRQEPVLRVGNLDVARDFLDVHDVVDAYVALIAAAGMPERFTVNIASGRPQRLRDLLYIMQGMARRSFRIEVDSARMRPSDVPVATGDASLLRRTTDWAPCVPIERTLAELLDAARAAEV